MLMVGMSEDGRPGPDFKYLRTWVQSDLFLWGHVPFLKVLWSVQVDLSRKDRFKLFNLRYFHFPRYFETPGRRKPHIPFARDSRESSSRVSCLALRDEDSR